MSNSSRKLSRINSIFNVYSLTTQIVLLNTRIYLKWVGILFLNQFFYSNVLNIVMYFFQAGIFGNKLISVLKLWHLSVINERVL